MKSVVKKNCIVNKESHVQFSYESLENYLNLELQEIPFDFNKNMDKISINLDMTPELVKLYKEKTAVRSRKLLNIQVKEEKVVRELRETEIRKFIVFVFSSRKLQPFLGQKFDLIYAEKEKGNILRRFLIFDFKDLKFPAESLAIIDNSVLSINKIAPPRILSFIDERQDYAVMKIFSLMEEHSKSQKNMYDVVVTFREEIIQYLHEGKNVNFRKYAHDEESYYFLYISRKKFEKFLKQQATTTLHIIFSNDKKFKFRLKDELYDQFLYSVKNFSKKEIQDMKENALKGLAPYYQPVKEFLYKIGNNEQFLGNKIKENRYLNNLKTQLGEFDLNELKINEISKRTKYVVDVKVFFLENNDILITRDLDLSYDSKKDIIEKKFIELCEDAYNSFLEKHSNQLGDNSIAKITDEEKSSIVERLRQLRLRSQENLHLNLLIDSYYYFAFFKKNIMIFKKSFGLKSRELQLLVMLNLALFNSFSKYYSGNRLCNRDMFFFYKDFVKFPEMNQKKVKIIFLRSKEILLLFECAQDLKYLKDIMQNWFESAEELDNLIKISYLLIKEVFNRFHTPHEVLAVSMFSAFILATDLDREQGIRLSHISEIEGFEITQFTLSLQIANLFEIYERTQTTSGRRSLKIAKEEQRDEIRKTIIREMLLSMVNRVKRSKENLDSFLEDFFFELSFFFSYEQFIPPLKLVARELIEFLHYVERRGKIDPQYLKLSKKYIQEFNQFKGIEEFSPKKEVAELDTESDDEKLEKLFDKYEEALRLNKVTSHLEGFKKAFREWKSKDIFPECDSKTEKMMLQMTFENIDTALKGRK
ncbi:MAG: hypothetical protein GF311_14830 [Candidatus Lokiarchaeota archaeon]|nr:hypothetical protein [Candidatus Lokiarchaeota archaeon]